MGFPIYFAGCDIVGLNVSIRKGQAFPPDLQDANILRGFAKAAGVKESLPFHRMSHVRIVDAGSPEEAQMLLHQGLTYEAAKQATSREAG